MHQTYCRVILQQLGMILPRALDMEVQFPVRSPLRCDESVALTVESHCSRLHGNG